jgi:hypothetical protein
MGWDAVAAGDAVLWPPYRGGRGSRLVENLSFCKVGHVDGSCAADCRARRSPRSAPERPIRRYPRVLIADSPRASSCAHARQSSGYNVAALPIERASAGQQRRHGRGLPGPHGPGDAGHESIAPVLLGKSNCLHECFATLVRIGFRTG